MQTKLTHKQVNANIKRTYAYYALSGLMFGNTVFTVFMLSKGLSYSQVSIIEAVFTAAIMLEILGGAFADIVGRKIAVLLRCITISVASLLFGFAYDAWSFLIANFVWGVGIALGAGADTALLYDSLKSAGKKKEFLKVFGTCRIFGFVAGMVGSVMGAYLYTVQQQLPFFAGAASSIVAGIVYFSAHESVSQQKYSVAAHYKQILAGLKYTLLHANIRWLTGLGMMAAMYFSFAGMIMSPYLLGSGFLMQHVGWIVALAMAVDALFTFFTERIHRFLGERTCFGLTISSYFVSSIGLAFVTGLPVLAFLFVKTFGTGFGTTFSEHYLQKHSQTRVRATVSSAEGFVEDLTMTLSLPLLGLLVDVTSINTTFLILGSGMFLFGLFLIAVFPVHRHKFVW